MSQERASRPSRATETARTRWAAGETSVNLRSDSDLDLEHFRMRVIQDALNEGRRQWWLRRALDFENARPRPGDFNGQATLEELRDRWVWCTEIAKACRARAEVAPLDDDRPEILHILREVS